MGPYCIVPLLNWIPFTGASQGSVARPVRPGERPGRHEAGRTRRQGHPPATGRPRPLLQEAGGCRGTCGRYAEDSWSAVGQRSGHGCRTDQGPGKILTDAVVFNKERLFLFLSYSTFIQLTKKAICHNIVCFVLNWSIFINILNIYACDRPNEDYKIYCITA